MTSAYVSEGAVGQLKGLVSGDLGPVSAELGAELSEGPVSARCMPLAVGDLQEMIAPTHVKRLVASLGLSVAPACGEPILAAAPCPFCGEASAPRINRAQPSRGGVMAADPAGDEVEP